MCTGSASMLLLPVSVAHLWPESRPHRSKGIRKLALLAGGTLDPAH